MTNEMYSNVAYRSNVQPVDDTCLSDDKFLNKIHNIFALPAILHFRQEGYTNYCFTPLQEKEYSDASLRCGQSPEGEYPFGTILDDNGKEIVVCKCLNVKCFRFKKCRPNFKLTEMPQIIKPPIKDTLLSFASYLPYHYVDIPKCELVQSEEEPIVEVAPISVVIPNNTLPEHKVMVPQLAEIQEPTLKPSEKLLGDTNEPEEKRTEEPIQVEEQKQESESEPEPGPEQVLFDAKGDFSNFEIVDQNKIITADVDRQIIVNAGPGTGKTEVLIRKLIYLIEEKRVEPENILVFCFSRDAIDVINKRLHAETIKTDFRYDFTRLDIRTLDSFATLLLSYAQNNLQDYPQLTKQDVAFEGCKFKERIELAIKLLKKVAGILSQNKHLVMDEIQDIVGCRAEFVLQMLSSLEKANCGFTIFGDACQGIYDWNSKDEDIEDEITSVEFYKDLFAHFPHASRYEFAKNYRQDDCLAKQLQPYRKAILSCDTDQMDLAKDSIKNNIKVSDVNLEKVRQDDFTDDRFKGSVAILTRTNAQALGLSSIFDTAGINFKLQRPTNSRRLDDWLVKFFGKYCCDNKITGINKECFMDVFNQLYPKLASDIVSAYWQALKKTIYLRANDNQWYDIGEILQGLLYNAKNSLLFKSPYYKEPKIVISNVHRSKGREFDHTILLNNIFDDNPYFYNEQSNNQQEHKVRYVALTRAKSDVQLATLEEQYIARTHDDEKRCFKKARSGKHFSKIEIGLKGDVNDESFALNEKIQDFIINKLKDGTRLKLIKCSNEMPITYDIVLEDQEDFVLGQTSAAFANGINHALYLIFGKSNNSHFKPEFNYTAKIDAKFYPHDFIDIYVDKHITCIARDNPALKGAQHTNGFCIWTGFTISGFARKDACGY